MDPKYTTDDALRIIHGADEYHMLFLDQFKSGVVELIDHLHKGQSERALIRAEGLRREIEGFVDQLSKRIAEYKGGDAPTS